MSAIKNDALITPADSPDYGFELDDAYYRYTSPEERLEGLTAAATDRYLRTGETPFVTLYDNGQEIGVFDTSEYVNTGMESNLAEMEEVVAGLGQALKSEEGFYTKFDEEWVYFKELTPEDTGLPVPLYQRVGVWVDEESGWMAASATIGVSELDERLEERLLGPAGVHVHVMQDRDGEGLWGQIKEAREAQLEFLQSHKAELMAIAPVEFAKGATTVEQAQAESGTPLNSRIKRESSALAAAAGLGLAVTAPKELEGEAGFKRFVLRVDGEGGIKDRVQLSAPTKEALEKASRIVVEKALADKSRSLADLATLAGKEADKPKDKSKGACLG